MAALPPHCTDMKPKYSAYERRHSSANTCGEGVQTPSGEVNNNHELLMKNELSSLISNKPIQQ